MTSQYNLSSSLSDRANYEDMIRRMATDAAETLPADVEVDDDLVKAEVAQALDAEWDYGPIDQDDEDAWSEAEAIIKSVYPQAFRAAAQARNGVQ